MLNVSQPRYSPLDNMRNRNYIRLLIISFLSVGVTFGVPISGSSTRCVTSCAEMEEGFYHSCKTCQHFVACQGDSMYVMNCPEDLQWDDYLKRCEWKSKTCAFVFSPLHEAANGSDVFDDAVESIVRSESEQEGLRTIEESFYRLNETMENEEVTSTESNTGVGVERGSSEESKTVTRAMTSTHRTNSAPRDSTVNHWAHLPFTVTDAKMLPSEFLSANNTCSIKSGGEVKTFDSFRYKFKGACKYILARDCDNSKLLVEAGFKVDKLKPTAATIDYVDIRTRDVWIRLHSMVLSFINGFAVPFGKTGSLNGVFAQTNAKNSTMKSEDGIEASFSDTGSFYVHLPAVYSGVVCGLCGNKDGDASNDEAKNFAEGYKSTSQDDFTCL